MIPYKNELQISTVKNLTTSWSDIWKFNIRKIIAHMKRFLRISCKIPYHFNLVLEHSRIFESSHYSLCFLFVNDTKNWFIHFMTKKE